MNAIKISTITGIVNEVISSEFGLDGGINHLEASLNKGGGNYWTIGIIIKKDNPNSKPYTLIRFELCIEGREIYFPPDSIGFDSINKTMEYAKGKMISYLEDLDIVIKRHQSMKD